LKISTLNKNSETKFLMIFLNLCVNFAYKYKINLDELRDKEELKI
jgi:hypothetical protein